MKVELLERLTFPEPFYTQMIKSTCFEMERTEDDRVNHLVQMYGDIDRSLLAGAFNRITPKLGGQNANQAIDALSSRRFSNSS